MATTTTTTITRRTLSTTPRYRLKEGSQQTGEELEKQKQEQLRKGEWHEGLASQSEAKLRADREKVEDHGEHIEKLQRETKTKGEKGELS